MTSSDEDYSVKSAEPSLVSTFEITEHTGIIVLVGAGGKTSLMYTLAKELAAKGGTVISVTTTKIFPPGLEEAPLLHLLGSNPNFKKLGERLNGLGHVTVGLELRQGKVQGVSPETIGRLKELARHIVVEADGAAGLSIKAPAAWEPVIPPDADLVIPVAGLDCLNRTISDENVFRLEQFLTITGEAPGAPVTPQTIARLLTHPEGMLKNIPNRASVIPFLNKVDCAPDDALKNLASEINKIRHFRIRAVLAGQLKPAVRVFKIS